MKVLLALVSSIATAATTVDFSSIAPGVGLRHSLVSTLAVCSFSVQIVVEAYGSSRRCMKSEILQTASANVRVWCRSPRRWSTKLFQIWRERGRERMVCENNALGFKSYEYQWFKRQGTYLSFRQGQIVPREGKNLVVLEPEDVVFSNSTNLCPVRDHDHVFA